MAEALPPPRLTRRQWTRRTSLTVRILAVNIIALGLMAGSLFYIDSYRKGLLAERFQLAKSEAEIAGAALAAAPPRARAALAGRIGLDQKLRLRLYDAKGKLAIDSFKVTGPAYIFADPAEDPSLIKVARALDHSMNWLLGADPIPFYAEPAADSATAWPELVRAVQSNQTIITQRAAPDETPVISAATRVGSEGAVLLVTRNAPDVTQAVRDARGTLAIVLAVTLLISIQLSLFLARTIVQPLR